MGRKITKDNAIVVNIGELISAIKSIAKENNIPWTRFFIMKTGLYASSLDSAIRAAERDLNLSEYPTVEVGLLKKDFANAIKNGLNIDIDKYVLSSVSIKPASIKIKKYVPPINLDVANEEELGELCLNVLRELKKKEKFNIVGNAIRILFSEVE